MSLGRLVVAAIGLVLIVKGVNTIRRRKGQYGWGDDPEEVPMVEGWSAVVAGAVELVAGIGLVLKPDWVWG